MRPLEEEEYDDSYFEKEMSRARSVKQEEEASEWHDSFMLSLQFFNIPQASRILPSHLSPTNTITTSDAMASVILCH